MKIAVHVEFLTEFGDLPLLLPSVQHLRHDHSYIQNIPQYHIMNVTQIRKGTKMDLECSAMGICNEYTGICNCMEGFLSSNGSLHAVGDRGDCSYYNPAYLLTSNQR